MPMYLKYPGLFLFVMAAQLFSIEVFAGVFLSSEASDQAPDAPADAITHPRGYTFDGFNTISVGLCIDPASESPDEIDVSIRNAVSVWNAQQPDTGNIRRGIDNDVPANRVDFESVLVHEMGHCLGLGHFNLATESELEFPNTDYAQSQKGPNGVFDVARGDDLTIGSADDVRADDMNRVWFRRNDNNPFALDDIVDNTTYSVNLADLPGTDTFAAIASVAVGTELGISNTEAVMVQGTNTDEAQRTLAAQDVATLRLGRAGLNEIQGDGDDYTVQYQYLGVSDSDGCDVVINVSGEDFAFCEVAIGQFPNPDNHFVLVNNTVGLVNEAIEPARMQFGSTSEVNWFFNQQLREDTESDPGATGSWFNPQRDGEGWVIEKITETVAGFYWFTYPPVGAEGAQTWLLDVGVIDGNTYRFEDVQITSGAVFGNNFDPDDVERQPWGSLEFEFDPDNPDTGTVSYSGPPEFGSGSFPITRFAEPSQQANGSLPAGITGSWFDPATDGEGWAIAILNDSQAVIYWFTYDDQGNPAWNGGVADIVGNTLVLNSRQGTGTNFGDDFVSDVIVRNFFGTITFTFSSCNSGTLTFNSILGPGTRTIQRITSVEGFACNGL